MADIRLVPAQSKHIGRIARHMRAIDAEECRAMGREPKPALRTALLTSERAVTALVDGQPEAMFGVVVEDAISGEGTPWFLGTDEVYQHGRALLSFGPLMVAYLGDSLRRLSNLVSAHNDRAIRLLRHWGFVVGDEQVDVRGVGFYRFEKDVS